MKGVISLVVSLVLAASASFLAPSTASANNSSSIVETSAPAAASAAGKPKRPITLTYDQIGRSTKVKLAGKATDYKNKKIILQRQKGKKWVKAQKQQTRTNGKFKFKVVVPRDGRKHAWRVMTKKSDDYGKSYSPATRLYWS